MTEEEKKGIDRQSSPPCAGHPSDETTATMHKRILEDALDKPPIPEFVDVKGAAKILKVSPSFLKKARMRGSGPPYAKFGERVRYNVSKILAYAKSRTRASTSDSGETA